MGFPHSEISGSKVAWHLPEAYRSFTTSFIATFSLGIHRTPLNFLLRNLKTIIHSTLYRALTEPDSYIFHDRSLLENVLTHSCLPLRKDPTNMEDKN